MKIEHLEKLRSLRELDLSRNKIRIIEPNSFLPTHNIVLLTLDDNSLKTTMYIERLENLKVLLIAGNRISEFSEIEKLADL